MKRKQDVPFLMRRKFAAFGQDWPCLETYEDYDNCPFWGLPHPDLAKEAKDQLRHLGYTNPAMHSEFSKILEQAFIVEYNPGHSATAPYHRYWIDTEAFCDRFGVTGKDEKGDIWSIVKLTAQDAKDMMLTERALWDEP